MNAKHTPGLWVTDEADHDVPYQDIKIKASKHRTVCTVWIDDSPVREFNAEQKANARLIAAAPELLEALKDLIAGYENTKHTGLMDMQVCGSDIIKARAAIAKATGTAK